MAEQCKKCFLWKFTPNDKCACGGSTKTVKPPKSIKTNVLPKRVSDKKRKRLTKEGTEGDFFKTLIKSRKKQGNNFCEVCNKPIAIELENVNPACFPHILSKKQYPALRYFENNVGMVCGIDHHNVFDTAVNLYRKEKGLKLLEEKIQNGGRPELSKYIDIVKKELKKCGKKV